MRNQKSKKTSNWPNFDQVRDEATRAFLNDLGQMISQMRRDIYDDLVALQSAPDPVDSLPTASAELRGRIFLLKGGAGVADVVKICIKDAADAYVFKTFTIT